MGRDTRSAFLRALKAVNLRVAEAFEQSVDDIRNSASLDLVEQAIADNDVARVIELLNLRPEFFSPLDRALRDAYIAGGDYQAGRIPVRLPDGVPRLVARFQSNAPRAAEWGNRVPGQYIAGLVGQQRSMVVQAVTEEATAGSSFRQIARTLIGERQGNRRVGGLIGLSDQQAAAVRAARLELQALDPAVLRRGAKGPDGRRRGGLNGNDRRRVRAAIDRGEQLSDAEVRAMLRRYSDRLLRHRGSVIARTEANRAMNAGRIEQIDQLLDDGRIRADMVTKVWQATPGDRTRDSHQALHEETVRWGEVFVSPITGASLRHPHDENAPAAETINCRCTLRVDVNWLALAA